MASARTESLSLVLLARNVVHLPLQTLCVQSLPTDNDTTSLIDDFDAALEEYLSDFPGPKSPDVEHVLAEFVALAPAASAAHKKAAKQREEDRDKRANTKKERAAAIEQQIRETDGVDGCVAWSLG